MKLSFNNAGVWRIALLVVLTLIAACADKASMSEKKKWKNFEIYYETRPAVVEKGMVEFIVIANEGGRRAADALVISLRAGEGGAWTQAIQDGQTGVYRRAIMVHDPNENFYIHVSYKEEETLLEYPMKPKEKP